MGTRKKSSVDLIGCVVCCRCCYGWFSSGSGRVPLSARQLGAEEGSALLTYNPHLEVPAANSLVRAPLPRTQRASHPVLFNCASVYASVCAVLRQMPPLPNAFGLEYWCTSPGNGSATRIGCTDPGASNYDPAPTFHTGCRYAFAHMAQISVGPANQTIDADFGQKVCELALRAVLLGALSLPMNAGTSARHVSHQGRRRLGLQRPTRSDLPQGRKNALCW